MDSIPIPDTGDWRPIAGRVALEIEEAPERVGSLYTPEVTRTQREQCITAKVVAVGYGSFTMNEEQENGRRKVKTYPGAQPEDFGPGDRVLYRPLAMEIGQKRIITDVRRVDGVIS